VSKKIKPGNDIIKLLIYAIFVSIVILGAIFVFDKGQGDSQVYSYPNTSTSWWDFQAVDTMKYSRDMAGAKLHQTDFDKTIDKQVKDIADIGATHVAIATPYDKEFVPFLRRWVLAARRHNLKVWFRGNFSGWEGWFEYKRISREEHLKLTKDFITNNQDLFENGDYFTACPECENGGPGNPFSTGDFEGHKQFLIDSYSVASNAFKNAGKNVQVNLNSMNGDVAKRIMDEKTTIKLGGVVTVDHYVSSEDQLNNDLNAYAKQAKSPVILGEYGAPIPDLHGDMSEDQQAQWIDKSMALLAKNSNLIGINYWTNMGGSTQLWKEDGTAKKAVETVKKYFKPKLMNIRIVDELNKPVVGARVVSIYKKASTDNNGVAVIPVLGTEELMYQKGGYTVQKWTINDDNNISVILRPTGLSLLYRLRLLLKSPF
jgi:hypothetical protein